MQPQHTGASESHARDAKDGIAPLQGNTETLASLLGTHGQSDPHSHQHGPGAAQHADLAAPDASVIIEDPVCRMRVNPHESPHCAQHTGSSFYFCSASYRERFAAEPVRFLSPEEREATPVPEGAVYTCPMHPEVRQVGLGTCPICGMALEPETGDLTGLLRARNLSRATMCNTRQNLIFALAYNAVDVPVAAEVLYPFFGILLSPVLAAAEIAFIFGHRRWECAAAASGADRIVIVTRRIEEV